MVYKYQNNQKYKTLEQLALK